MRNLPDIFLGVVVASLLILTAWGNAIVMCVFSFVALAAWFAIPELRNRMPRRRGLLVSLVSIAIAFAIAFVLT